MNRRRTILGVALSALLVAGTLAIGSSPASAATIDVECFGADTDSQNVLNLLGSLGTPPSPPPVSLEASVVTTIDPTSLVQGSNTADFFVELALPADLLETATGVGITEADISDVLFELAPGAGISGPNVVGEPDDFTVQLADPDTEVGPFTSTFEVTADNFSTVEWNLVAAELRIGVQLGENALDFGIDCDQVGSGAAVAATVLPPVDISGPVVDPLEATTDEDTPVEIDLNEGISDGPYETDLSTLAIVSDPSNGTAVLGDNGIVTYTPDAGFTGEDQFAYEVCSIDVVEETTTTFEATTSTAPPVDDVVDEVVRAAQGRERFCNSALVTVTVNPVGGETTTTAAPEVAPVAQPQAQPATFTG